MPFQARQLRFKLEAKRPARALSFEESREEVTRDLTGRKQMEALTVLHDEVRRHHPVEIVDEKLRAALGPGAEGANSAR